MTMRLSPGVCAGLVLCCLMAAAPAAAQQLPPPQVSVQEMTPEALPVVNELPGRVAATRTAEVRPRVGGIVIERVFEQGGKVEAGDVLYRIDPAPYDVRVASAEGALARAEATALNAADQEKRARALRERKVTAGVDLDNAATALAQAQADVAIARASLQEAQLNRSYTEVAAPIAGVVGRALVTEGALVNAQTDIMATIQQLDPVYVDFTQSSSELFALRRALAAGQLAMISADAAAVRLIFDDGSEYAHPGKLLFSEASVDSSTGQITLRAEFPNPEGDLLPGLYVRVRIEQAVRDNALTVPQMAVQRDQSGQAYVYALKDADTVERRDVTLGQTAGNRWLVESGLKPGDRVVVAGAQKLYPDAKVVPQPVDAAQPAVPAGAAAAAEAPAPAPAQE
ncbi:MULTISPECIES: efflux RND transporter periplasmic adaptor subunit [Paracoccus]|uniref:Efflux transporter, RND family, MFP subunit n=1 Tax=Paracoccus denitrificans (strain Pd 1222) TaxID=318586 RepID=A1B681_PARDP|nr:MULTISPECIES: efflux RND transporter periplasmic adaptor subunit [Paracoccus]ABL71025.1 efflux transporter, RND family, MFP subunit [Paracoccus denitrificans PD1222]MBB4629544.1 membrane fusion protein (multidrug efflux system) [Paracoccus denitrificans]MCU7431533.1 efflux RND transporter periplasmic adaptor subunit [Paracoccus denitrificans]QAR27700.1 efflux RND transporter periplasmic adaptor subunit [Paracoccus denitrificans]UFS67114.1 efflux RND transporter periplasmic adaptor subunit [